MDNLIQIWGSRNINKPNKPVAFEQWDAQTWWIDPAIIDYIDPVKCLVYCGDNLVFKLHREDAVEQLVTELNGDEK